MPMWLMFVKEILPQWSAVILLGIFVIRESRKNTTEHQKIVNVLTSLGHKVHELHKWHDVDTPGKPGVKIWWEANETLLHHSTVLHEIKSGVAANGSKVAQIYSTVKANQEYIQMLEREAIKRAARGENDG